MIADCFRRLQDVSGHERLRWSSGKRRTAHEQLVGHHTEGVEVGAMIGARVTRNLLRRHVRGRAKRHTDRRQTVSVRLCRRADSLCHAEVRHHRVLLRHEDVLGLDVPMDDALPMRVRQRRRHFAKQMHRVLHGYLLATRQTGAQRLPFDEGHREVRKPARLACRQQWDDVRVLQSRGEADLALEALDRHARGHVRRQHLHHHRAPERRVRRQEHPRHAPATELALQGVARTQRMLQLVTQVRRHGETSSLSILVSSRGSVPIAS